MGRKERKSQERSGRHRREGKIEKGSRGKEEPVGQRRARGSEGKGEI